MNVQSASSGKCENINTSGGSGGSNARADKKDIDSNCTLVELSFSAAATQAGACPTAPLDDTVNQRNCGNNENTEISSKHVTKEVWKPSENPRNKKANKRPLWTLSRGIIDCEDTSGSSFATPFPGKIKFIPSTNSYKLNEVRTAGEQLKTERRSIESGFDCFETRDSRRSKDFAFDINFRKRKNIGIILLDFLRINRPKKTGTIKDDDIKNTMRFDKNTTVVSRALPPTPVSASSCMRSNPTNDPDSPVEPRDFAASLERVKDCGWYWGPLASEEAENLLKNEPDGSFIVRDSSDAHYIFSLTFKLNGSVRHVRIEHDQGNFSFGPLTKFKASTIVEFVEKAVAHSRSGRYLFFLHRRPALGPMQVQLLHPYSRFRHPRSLQHMCRFVILKYVRRDLVHTLPLPKLLQDYLNTPHYYFEQHELSGKLN